MLPTNQSIKNVDFCLETCMYASICCPKRCTAHFSFLTTGMDTLQNAFENTGNLIIVFLINYRNNHAKNKNQRLFVTR